MMIESKRNLFLVYDNARIYAFKFYVGDDA